MATAATRPTMKGLGARNETGAPWMIPLCRSLMVFIKPTVPRHEPYMMLEKAKCLAADCVSTESAPQKRTYKIAMPIKAEIDATGSAVSKKAHDHPCAGRDLRQRTRDAGNHL